MTLIQEFLHLMYQKSTHKVGGHSIALACRMRKWEVNALFSLLKWNEMKWVQTQPFQSDCESLISIKIDT